MLRTLISSLRDRFPAPTAHAHCDGPCGVYDPADARIKAEAVLSMTKKLLAMTPPAAGADQQTLASYHNTMGRYISIKEEQAHKCKEELLVLWTDFFKPAHLEKTPDLHDIFWKATKLCSACKQEVNLEHAEELMGYCKKIHEIFWAAKGREVTYYTAS